MPTIVPSSEAHGSLTGPKGTTQAVALVKTELHLTDDFDVIPGAEDVRFHHPGAKYLSAARDQIATTVQHV